jgi:hypothetical protein
VEGPTACSKLVKHPPCVRMALVGHSIISG